MVKKSRLLLIASLIVATAIGVSCAIYKTHSPIRLNSEKALAVYTEATDTLDLTCATYQVSQIKILQLNGQPLEHTQHQIVQYFAKDSDLFEANVWEEIIIGNHKIQSSEYFLNNTFYSTIGQQNFSGAMTQEEFLARYAPILLIDPQLYKTINGTKKRGLCTLSFTDASAPEAWSGLNGEDLLHAEATATIAADGFLKECRYACEYIADGVATKLTVTVARCSEAYELDDFNPPDKIISICDPTAPKQLEIACGYLLATVQVQSQYTDEIYCQAFDDHRNQSITVSANALSTDIATKISLKNGNQIGPESEVIKEESFRDGHYSISINGATATNDPAIDAEKMKQYYQNILIGTIMLPAHISDVAVSQSENSVIYTFSGNESFTDLLRSDACETLYQDAEILTNQTHSYTTETALFFLEVNSKTGLPRSSGFQYTGIYRTDDLPYRLDYSADQCYVLSK